MIRILILTLNGEVTEVFSSREQTEVEVFDKDDQLDDEEVSRLEKQYPWRIL